MTSLHFLPLAATSQLPTGLTGPGIIGLFFALHLPIGCGPVRVSHQEARLQHCIESNRRCTLFLSRQLQVW
ncbi:uncharacterized protein BDW70DRAFT_144867 [Aspergillus foveolatus]|uniref:uncharacterized protein n=1 Tax=Aspergillus foveolatus TaxID=210207 RepID=UPI003CCD5912